MALNFPSIVTWPTKKRDLRKGGKGSKIRRAVRRGRRISMSTGSGRRSFSGKRTN